MSADKYLLRIEGVNLSSVLDDTAEISVRRSAGLMLRQAIIDIKELLGTKAMTISSGASVGLFEITGDISTIKEAVVSSLNDNYSFLTFVVDTEIYADDFKLAHERVIAKNRYRQFQQLTLVAPVGIDKNNGPCDKDHLRPATKIMSKGSNEGSTFNVSPEVKTRAEKGKKDRQTFYQKELNSSKCYEFTDDFNDIARASGKNDYANLNDKMAVIYLDGNSFGKIQRSCNTAEELHAFDTQNQDYRKSFLEALVANAIIYNSDHKKIFMETLLWGGDEMILVVPAWKGMELMQFFYKQSKDWMFTNPITKVEHKLTYAGGVVFCQHKTPISQVVKSVIEIADNIKNTDKGRVNAYFDYLVLESIDYPTQSISDFWKLRYGEKAYKQRTYLKPHDFPDDLDKTLEQLPRGAIYEIAQEWINYWESPNDVLKEKIERFRTVNKEAVYEQLFTIFTLLSIDTPSKDTDKQHENSAWLHLVELWDYLAPVNRKEKEA